MKNILKSLFLVGLVFFLSACTCKAADRFYGPRGEYLGKSTQFGRSTYHYNNRGTYLGRSSPFGGRYNHYNNRGGYLGRSNSTGVGVRIYFYGGRVR